MKVYCSFADKKNFCGACVLEFDEADAAEVSNLILNPDVQVLAIRIEEDTTLPMGKLLNKDLLMAAGGKSVKELSSQKCTDD